MAPAVKKTSKPIFKTSIPFTETHWPQFTSIDRNNILDLLCNLLQPLGDHRRNHIQPSKGKKRKRNSKQTIKEDNNTHEVEKLDAPPPPEIGNHVLIGLNSVTRHLEALAAKNAPSTAPAAQASRSDPLPASEDKENISSEPAMEEDQQSPDTKDSGQNLRPLSLVLIPHNHPPASIAHAHLPTLVHVSSHTSLSSAPSPTTPSTATRLIAVPPGCEPRLASTLHIPRVGAIGILEGAPGADGLVQYIREHVDVTYCKWLDEAVKAEWKGVKMDAGKG